MGAVNQLRVRRICRVVAVATSLLLALSATLGICRCFISAPSEALHTLSRRQSAVAAVVSSFGLSLGTSSPASAALSGRDHDILVAIESVLKDIQEHWPDLEKKGAAGAQEIVDVLSGSNTRQFQITVPAGNGVGVEIEDRRVTSVSSRYGFAIGDVIVAVNDEFVKDDERLVAASKKAKDQGDVRYSVERLQVNLFVTLDKAVSYIYSNADADTPLVEPDDVQKEWGDFKNLAALAKDGIVEMPELKKQLDGFIKTISTFAAA
eukprot:TRINITY_DN35544_c0_g1_i2.p1 TRINITY_DN35544_c0_g1~~TRINITY_DN35544_c0_g1_i2.p1  ORF type:complete len:264 (+),score=36.72 TRINITY_DN35544_c0_g1_i2:63-854(+)